MSAKGDPKRGFFRRRFEAGELPVSGVWVARRRLAAAMRRVIERLTTSNAPETELDAAARRLEEYAEHLATHPRRERYVGFSESALADAEREDEEARGGGHFDYSPLIGRSNPLAPPIDVTADDDGAVTARVVFGSAYEGPPGCVHGGVVAAAFDEVLGYAETFSGHPGMTGTLNVVYRTPTPLHTELVFRAMIEKVEGRKIYVHGTLHAVQGPRVPRGQSSHVPRSEPQASEADERLCAESDAIFVSMRPGRYLELMKERKPRSG